MYAIKIDGGPVRLCIHRRAVYSSTNIFFFFSVNMIIICPRHLKANEVLIGAVVAGDPGGAVYYTACIYSELKGGGYIGRG